MLATAPVKLSRHYFFYVNQSLQLELPNHLHAGKDAGT